MTKRALARDVVAEQILDALADRSPRLVSELPIHIETNTGHHPSGTSMLAARRHLEEQGLIRVWRTPHDPWHPLMAELVDPDAPPPWIVRASEITNVAKQAAHLLGGDRTGQGLYAAVLTSLQHLVVEHGATIVRDTTPLPGYPTLEPTAEATGA